MIPSLDTQIGIGIYSTKFSGIGGKIRVSPADFQVSEILSKKAQAAIGEHDGYAVYKLRKQRIDTNHALGDIFRKKGLRLKALGLKDTYAITEQFVCSGKKGKSIDFLSI